MENKDDILLIEKYLAESVTQEEAQAIEDRLKRDPSFKADFDFLKLSKEGARRNVLENKLDFIKSLESEPPSLGKNKKNLWKWIVAVLVTLLVLLCLFRKSFTPAPPTEEQIYLAANFDDFVLHEISRASTEEVGLTLDQQKAYGYFVLENFNECIPLLENLWEQESDTLALYYLGLSRLATGELDESQRILKKEELSNYNTQQLIPSE